jgi:ATP-dependent Clp protease ATP-binding subunit ClpB
MQMDKFTLKAQAALQEAQRMAHARSHQEWDSEHLLLALIDQTESLVPQLLQRLKVNLPQIRIDLEHALDRRVKVSGTSSLDLFPSPTLKRALDGAAAEASQLRDEYISAEHLVLGLLKEPSRSLKQLLQVHGIQPDKVLQALAALRGHQRVTDPNPEDKFQALEKYGRDLTALARAGKIDPVIGRDEEIRRVMQVLSRRTKNNPVLIGEPGVGKTAIVEEQEVGGHGPGCHDRGCQVPG